MKLAALLVPLSARAVCLRLTRTKTNAGANVQTTAKDHDGTARRNVSLDHALAVIFQISNLTNDFRPMQTLHG